MLYFLQTFSQSMWTFVVASAPYLLLGLSVAGVVHVYVKSDDLKKFLGENSIAAVIKAALIGIPLPLCSCAVVPAAASLRKSGASKAATSSFLISTPESGVDSIAVTYSLMGLPMAIIRPVAAFLTAFVAGLGQIFFNLTPEDAIEKTSEASCCKKTNSTNIAKESRFRQAIRYSFVDLLDDMAMWLVFGLLVGAFINAAIPTNFFEGTSGIGSRLLILGVGIPFYICASASTPIAASLILKGMSPGTALILLLVGPATNISNIVVIQKYIGKKGVMINIASIAIVSFILSYLVDWLFQAFLPQMNFHSHFHEHAEGGIISLALTIVFLTLLGFSLKRIMMKKIGAKN